MTLLRRWKWHAYTDSWCVNSGGGHRGPATVESRPAVVHDPNLTTATRQLSTNGPVIKGRHCSTVPGPRVSEGSAHLKTFCQRHRRNNRRDRGRLVPQLLSWGPTMYWSPNVILGCSFQKARNFTASSHQDAGFSIWVFKKFSGVIPRTLTAEGGDPFRIQHPARPLTRRGAQAPRSLDPNLGRPQLFSPLSTVWRCKHRLVNTVFGVYQTPNTVFGKLL